MIIYTWGKQGKYYFTEIIDEENPKNNYKEKILITDYHQQAESYFKEMKSKVAIGNYYSFDGIEYAEKIETNEDVKEVLEEIGYDGLCTDVWTKEEYLEALQSYNQYLNEQKS